MRSPSCPPPAPSSFPPSDRRPTMISYLLMAVAVLGAVVLAVVYTIEVLL